MLVPGPVQLVVMAVELDGTRIHEMPRRVMETEPAYIERPEVKAGLPLDDPFRHHSAGAAARGDAVEETGRAVEVLQLRRLAHDEIGIGRIWDRPVDQLTDADGVDDRRALGGEL